MKLSGFGYILPNSLISQKAIEPRDSCRLMTVDRQTKKIDHKTFSDLPKILDKNTVLVLNDSKVFPARLLGIKETGGKTEILLLKQLTLDSYSAIGKGRLKIGTKINFSSDLMGEITSVGDGEVNIRFNQSGVILFKQIDNFGKTPLPPYIHSKAKEDDLRLQYQTVYAKEKGSAAAPTAGLHFTEKLLEILEKNRVQIEKLTLHVGLGTFKPVTPEQVALKTLHSERYCLSSEVASRLNLAKKQGKKIIAVGTTTCRVLETLTNDRGELSSGEGETNIFIQPGYKYKFIDGLITNFHLPKTSLLMLVTALVSFPNSPTPFTNFLDSLMGKAYQQAINQEYRFFSFGDAMIII